MIYPYKCSKCGSEYDVYRPVSECSQTEICKECNQEMHRLYTVPHTIIRQSDYFHVGLGKRISNSSQVKDELKKYQERTGKELIEIGNERLPEVKPESRYEFTDKETRGIHRILESAGVQE